MKKTHLLVLGMTATFIFYGMLGQASANGRYGYRYSYNTHGLSFRISYSASSYPSYYSPPSKYYHYTGNPHWRSKKPGLHKHYKPPVKRYRKHYGRHWQTPEKHDRKYYGKQCRAKAKFQRKHYTRQLKR